MSATSRRVRAERFGAWVRLDDATLVAVDRPLARTLGVDGGSAWRDDAPDESSLPPPRPLEVHVAVTSRCPVACAGCYQDASPRGHDVPRAELDATLAALADAGVFTVAFGGGEPLARADLAELGAAARRRGLVPVVTTSGVGLTAARARELAAVFAQVNVSHDGVGGAYRAVRGFDGASAADRAIELLVAAGAAVGVNLVLTRESFAHVEATADHVRALGARELQLLRYKPAGRAAASLEYLARRLDRAQVAAVYPLLERLATRHQGALAVRIDCAMVPFLAPHVARVEALARWGVFGCEAGRHLGAVTREGALAPCSFVAAHDASGGSDGASARRAAFVDEWERDAGTAVAPFRAFVAHPPAPCATCALAPVCRGGCKVVSQHLAGGGEGGFVPDPECPRVAAHHAAEKCEGAAAGAAES